MICPQRCDAQPCSTSAFRDGAAAIWIDHLDEIHIGPDMNTIVRSIFGAHQAGFAHTEDVEDFRAPGAPSFSRLAADRICAEQPSFLPHSRRDQCLWLLQD